MRIARDGPAIAVGRNETLVGIGKMLARTTRLELLIVNVAILVLLFCSKPPRSGSAQVPDSAPAAHITSETLAPDDPLAPQTQPEEDVEPDGPNAADQGANGQPTPRVGSVDARNISDLRYGDVMYGDVTVRWVWNGTRFVPQKVCIVKEKDGVSSVWSFDQQDKATVSEVSGPPGTAR